MITNKNYLKQILKPFFKSIFRFIYLLFIPLIPFTLMMLVPHILPFSIKTNQKIEAVCSIIVLGFVFLGWYRSQLAISFFEQFESFSKAHYLSGEEIRFKCSYLPIIGKFFTNKE